MRNFTVRPGLLVFVSSAIKGNVSYSTTDLGITATPDGAEESRWQTDRLIRNKEEQERAVKARALARSKIQGICVAMEGGGMLCPQERSSKLYAAETEAMAIVREFNASAEITSISFNLVTGTVAPDDARAVRAINQEMGDLIEAMQRGIASLDVDAVRKAANRAKTVGRMLEPNAQASVQKAIDLARAAAKEIVKAGEAASVEIDQVTIQRLAEARTQFLDLDDAATVANVAAHDVRGVDFEPAPEAPAPVAPAAPAPDFDMGEGDFGTPDPIDPIKADGVQMDFLS